MVHPPVQVVIRGLVHRRVVHGVGVGLVIVADFMALMDGRVPKRLSQPNVHTVFHHTNAVKLSMFAGEQ